MFLFRVFRNSLSFLSSDLRMVLSQIADCASSIAADRRDDGTVSLHFTQSDLVDTLNLTVRIR